MENILNDSTTWGAEAGKINTNFGKVKKLKGINFALNGSLKEDSLHDLELVFNRSSTSYDENGDVVAIDIPVYSSGIAFGKKAIQISKNTTNLLTESQSLLIDTEINVVLEAGTYTVSINKGTGRLACSNAATGLVDVNNNLTFTIAAQSTLTLTPTGIVQLVQIEPNAYQTHWVKGGTTKTDGDAPRLVKSISGEFGVGITFKVLNSMGDGTPNFKCFYLRNLAGDNLDVLMNNDYGGRLTAGLYTSVAPAVYTGIQWAKNDIISVYLHYIPGIGMFLYNNKNGKTVIACEFRNDLPAITFDHISIGHRGRAISQRDFFASGYFWGLRVDLANEGQNPNAENYFKNIGVI